AGWVPPADGHEPGPADGEQGDVVLGFAAQGLVEEVIEELVEVGGTGRGGCGEGGEAFVDGLGAVLDDAVGVEEEGRAGGEDGDGLAVEGIGGNAEGEGSAAFEVSGRVAVGEEEGVGVPGAGVDDHS